MPTPPPPVSPALAGSSTDRSSIHRQARLRAGLYPLASAAVLLGFCSAAPLAAQEGAAPGTDTAIEPVELPDPRDLIYAGEENPGLPQPVDPEIIDCGWPPLRFLKRYCGSSGPSKEIVAEATVKVPMYTHPPHLIEFY